MIPQAEEALRAGTNSGALMPVSWVQLVAVSGEGFVEQLEKSGGFLFVGSPDGVQRLCEESQDELVVAVPEAAVGEHPVVGPVSGLLTRCCQMSPTADLYLESVLGIASRS